MTALRTAADILDENRIALQSTALGRHYATCPRCSAQRRKANQKLKCLGVTVETDGVKFGCNHCGWTGGGFYRATERGASSAAVDPAALALAQAKAAERQRSEVAHSQIKVRRLWSQRQQARGSIAETYLRECRGYRGHLPVTLGFLPARGEHCPAMIAAFGVARETDPGELVIDDNAVAGVHITKLKPDGSDKAGIEGEPDKITVGLGNTSPIWLAPINDGLGLVIAEGIEDALSAHQSTGLAAWAAGTAGRLPAMADAVPDYVDTVTILVDADDNGEKNSIELAQRLVARGIEVLMALPGGSA